jgi:hypothetical protein
VFRLRLDISDDSGDIPIHQNGTNPQNNWVNQSHANSKYPIQMMNFRKTRRPPQNLAAYYAGMMNGRIVYTTTLNFKMWHHHVQAVSEKPIYT